MGLVGTMFRAGALLVLGCAVLAGIAWHFLQLSTEPPTLPIKYWGPGNPKEDNPSIKPFKINISNEVLDDLQDRLELLPPLTPPLEGANFRYGFNSDYLQKVVHFWFNEYNWRDREAFLNSLPQFKTQIAGLNLHYIHVKPARVPPQTKVVPLLLLHGWPGSVREFYELIPLLTTPHPNRDFVFEVVAPSLPGYGFSDGASKQGLGAAEVAVVMKSLMERVGFKQFYVQGGDWGALIGSNMAVLYPDHILGYHSNMCVANSPLTTIKQIATSFWPSLFIDEKALPRYRGMGERFLYLMEETGYFHIQATKPDTVSVGLRDSPVGLAAYILEKFSTWTDPAWRSLPDGGLTKKYTLTNLLDNVMIYWVTGSITTSVRLYSETINKAQMALGIDRVLCTVPTACALFPHELDYQPEFLLKDRFSNLVQVTHMPRGGHFAAFEEPKLLSEDIWQAVGKMRNLPKKT